jgi:hypothetical protein
MQTSTLPAPQPARTVPPPDRHLKESENSSPPHQSRPRPAVPRHRSAKSHPTASGETQRNFPPPAENRSLSKPPAPPKTPPAEPPARSKHPICMSGENTHPRTSRAPCLFPHRDSATDNEAALPAFHSQGAWMEALRTHNLGVCRASRCRVGRAHPTKQKEKP